MNLGWYEIMDRVAMIQDQIESQVGSHPERDDTFDEILDKAQKLLSEAYQYAGEKFNDSCEDVGDV